MGLFKQLVSDYQQHKRASSGVSTPSPRFTKLQEQAEHYAEKAKPAVGAIKEFGRTKLGANATTRPVKITNTPPTSTRLFRK